MPAGPDTSDPRDGAAAAPAAAPAGGRIARNIVALGLSEVATRGLTILTALVVARSLGPAAFGQVAVAQTLALYIAAFSDGGLTLLAYRRIVVDPKAMSQLVADTTVIQAAISLAMTVLLVVVALAAPFDARLTELLIVFAPYALTQGLSLMYALQSLEEMRAVAVVKTATQIATAVPTIALVLATHNPVWVAAGLVAGQFLGDVLFVARLRRHHGLRFLRPRLDRAPGMLREGAPLLGSFLLFNYAGTIDTLVLGLLKPTTDVGHYSAAARVTNMAVLLNQVVYGAVLPELVRRFHTGRDALRDFTDGLVALTLRATLAGSALVVVIAGPVVAALYGDAYRSGATVLAILAPGVALLWYAHLVGYALIAAERQREYLRAIASAAALATVVYPAATVAFGIDGMAAAVTLNALTQAVTFTYYSRTRLGLPSTAVVRGELPYFVAPIALAGVGALVIDPFPALSAAVLWFGGVAAVEAVRGWPIRGMARQLRAVAGR